MQVTLTNEYLTEDDKNLLRKRTVFGGVGSEWKEDNRKILAEYTAWIGNGLQVALIFLVNENAWKWEVRKDNQTQLKCSDEAYYRSAKNAFIVALQEIILNVPLN